MTVKQLITELKKLPSSHEILLSSDAEGNNFHKVGGIFYPDETSTTAIIYPTHEWVELE